MFAGLVAWGLVAWWAAAWGRSVGWALAGSILLSPLVWMIVLLVLGRRPPEPTGPTSAALVAGAARLGKRASLRIDAAGRGVCPGCGAKLDIPPGRAHPGTYHECHFCSTPLRVALGPPLDPEPEAPSLLRPCPACGRDVSRRATACPHCGDPLTA